MPWINETEMNYGSMDRLKDGFSYITQKTSNAFTSIKKPTLGPRAKRWLQGEDVGTVNGEVIVEEPENSFNQIDTPPFFQNLMTKEQVQYGGFLVYLCGKLGA